jgi:hexosaminidase
VLATLPLPNPDQAGRSFALDASLPAQHGEHALCLIFTAPIDRPLYAMARIALLPTGTK